MNSMATTLPFLPLSKLTSPSNLTHIFNPPIKPTSSLASSLSFNNRTHFNFVLKASQNNNNNDNIQPESTSTIDDDDKKNKSNKSEEQEKLGNEIKKAMKERNENGFWGGVFDEIGRIEWPEFGKVVATTGVVLGVIAGSSVVLLTVNFVLAELSDRVFAGKGVQDFFG